MHEREQLARASGLPDRSPLRARVRRRPAAVPPLHRPREPLDLPSIEAQRLADVAHRAARAVRDDGGRERRALAAVLLVDVLDDFLAALVLEVDVDVGRLVAFARDEALEQQRHARRVDLGDAQAVADGGIGGRAASLAEDAARAREAHDVVHGQEIRLVAQLGDQLELVLDDGARPAAGAPLGQRCCARPPR